MSTGGFEDARSGAARGDQAAISALYRELNPPLVRYLRHQVGRFAEDTASDVWMGLVPQLAGFDGSLAQWRVLMFTIARRRVVDHHRRRGRTPEPFALDETWDQANTADTEEQVIDNLTAQDAVAALVRGLPPDQAEIVLLRVLGGLDAAEVAEIVGKSTGAVRIAQHRALQRLERTWRRKVVTR